MIIYPSLEDITLYLVGADLTTDGVQYGAEISTTTIDTDVVIYEKTIGYMHETDLIWVYFLLCCAFKAAANDTPDVKWKAQVRNKDKTWIDLFAYQDYADIGTDYLDKKMEGYAKIQAGFNEMPFDFRIVFQCDTLNKGRAKLKNNSLIRIVCKRRF